MDVASFPSFSPTVGVDGARGEFSQPLEDALVREVREGGVHRAHCPWSKASLGLAFDTAFYPRFCTLFTVTNGAAEPLCSWKHYLARPSRARPLSLPRLFAHASDSHRGDIGT